MIDSDLTLTAACARRAVASARSAALRGDAGACELALHTACRLRDALHDGYAASRSFASFGGGGIGARAEARAWQREHKFVEMEIAAVRELLAGEPK